MPAIDVGWAALAGFAGGYVMSLGATWLEGAFGLPRLDFGHTGVKYLGGERAGSWLVGVVFHLVDSVLLGLLYAVTAYVWLRPGGVLGGIAAGMAYGVVLWLFLAMLLVMPLMGAGPFARSTGSWRPAAAYLVLHLTYGAILGGVYVPPI